MRTKKIFFAGKYYSTFRKSLGIISIALLFLFVTSCDVNNGDDDKLQPCPPFLTVPTPPYDSPCWHPSGDFIGFNYTPLLKINYPYGEHCQGEFVWDISMSGFWLINIDGTNMHRIFSHKLQSPVWAPDGEWIAFVEPVGDERHIFKMRFDGSTFDTTTIVQLTTEGRNFVPSWSPDGQWIAFDSNVNSPNGMQFIWKMKSDGTQKTRLAYDPTKGEIRLPSWSRDGNKIVHIRYIGVGAPEVFVMDKNGNNLIRLTNNTNDDRFPHYVIENQVVFWGTGNLWITDSLGSSTKQITTAGVDVDFGTPFDRSPFWNKIVYTKYWPYQWNYENGTLWMVDLITGEKKQLTFNIIPNNKGGDTNGFNKNTLKLH